MTSIATKPTTPERSPHCPCPSGCAVTPTHSSARIHVLVNVLVLTGLTTGVVQIPRATCSAPFSGARHRPRGGNVYYPTWPAAAPGSAGPMWPRCRTDRVSAYVHRVFVVMLPIYLKTRTPPRLGAGVAWAFIIGAMC